MAIDEVQLEHRLSLLEQDIKSVHRRLDNVERLTESVHILATEMKATREDLNDTIDRVCEIEHRPQKRYDTLVTAIITGLVTGILGVVIGLIF